MDVQYEQWMQESAHFIFIVFTSYTEDKLVHEGDAADVAVNCWSIAKKKINNKSCVTTNIAWPQNSKFNLAKIKEVKKKSLRDFKVIFGANAHLKLW